MMDNGSFSISLVIVNWNSGSWLKKCLQGVAAQTVQPEQVLLIDNCSTDCSLTDLEKILPYIKVVRQKENLGFSKANNIALQSIDGSRWTVLLNPDAIPEPEWLESLLIAAERNPEYSFFASKMIDALHPDLFDGAGDILHVSGLGWRRFNGSLSKNIQDIESECFGACAGAAMYKTEILKKLGSFDGHFFCYFEDVDLSFRFRLAGHLCLYVPSAVVLHVGSVSSGGKQSDFAVYYGHRNLVWTYIKNMPGWLFWVCLPVHLLMNIISILVFIWRGKGKTILHSKRDAFLGLPKMWRKRRQIQSERVVSIGEIWRVLDKRIFFSGKNR